MLHILSFFSSKCSLFHNATFFGSCIIHILHTGCDKIKKEIRRQRVNDVNPRVLLTTSDISEKSDGWARTYYIISKFTYFLHLGRLAPFD
jgi:hypothetical protein